MKKIIYLILILFSIKSFCQIEQKVHQPYIKVVGKADTLVIPDEIHIGIILSKKELKRKNKIEESIKNIIISNNLDLKNNLIIEKTLQKNVGIYGNTLSKIEVYVIKILEIEKASKIFYELNKIGLSFVIIYKSIFYNESKIQIAMNSKAILNAKINAESYLKPLRTKTGKVISIEYANQGIYARINNPNYRIISHGIPSDENDIEIDQIRISSEIISTFSID